MPTAGHDAERSAIDGIVDRLAVEFPHVPADEVVQRVDEEHRRFDGRPIRDFVPIFVERAVKRALSSR